MVTWLATYPSTLRAVRSRFDVTVRYHQNTRLWLNRSSATHKYQSRWRYLLLLLGKRKNRSNFLETSYEEKFFRSTIRNEKARRLYVKASSARCRSHWSRKREKGSNKRLDVQAAWRGGDIEKAIDQSADALEKASNPFKKKYRSYIPTGAVDKNCRRASVNKGERKQ